MIGLLEVNFRYNLNNFKKVTDKVYTSMPPMVRGETTFIKVNAFETNLTADWKKKATDDEEEGRAEKKEEKSEETLTGGRGVRERDGWGRGVFPLLAMLNHNCASNARFLSFKESWAEG